MELFTLASGSSGNCTVVRAGEDVMLIDAGISCKRICDGLKAHGISPDSIRAVLITHEHIDHISGLTVLLKKFPVPIYTSAPTGRALCYRMAGIEKLIRPVEAGNAFSAAGLRVLPFSTPHDTAGSLGFTFSDGIRRGAVATDMGHLTEEASKALRGADLVLLEANYEEDWLKSGSYPAALKQRILGENGHLSNAESGRFACELAASGTGTILLGHLSKENNSPQQAERVVCRMLERAGFRPGRDLRLEVAPRSVSSPVYPV